VTDAVWVAFCERCGAETTEEPGYVPLCCGVCGEPCEVRASTLVERLLLDLPALLAERVQAVGVGQGAAEKPARSRRRDLLTLSEAAERLGISRNETLHKLIASGELDVVRVAGRPKVSVDAIESLKRRRPAAQETVQRRASRPSRPRAVRNEAGGDVLERWTPPRRQQ